MFSLHFSDFRDPVEIAKKPPGGWPVGLSHDHHKRFSVLSNEKGSTTRESFQTMLFDNIIDGYICKRIKDGPVLIIYDGPHCHAVDISFLNEKMKELSVAGIEVILYVLPHLTSLATQPCDRGPFALLKRVRVVLSKYFNLFLTPATIEWSNILKRISLSPPYSINQIKKKKKSKF